MSVSSSTEISIFGNNQQTHCQMTPSIGISFPNNGYDQYSILINSMQIGYDFVACVMKDPDVITTLLDLKDWDSRICQLVPVPRTPTVTLDITKEMVLILPALLDCFLDTAPPQHRLNAEKILITQLLSAAAKNLCIVLLRITDPQCGNILKFLKPIIKELRLRFWVELPIAAGCTRDSWSRPGSPDPWEFWHQLTSFFGNITGLGLTLRINDYGQFQEFGFKRWEGGCQCVTIELGLLKGTNCSMLNTLKNVIGEFLQRDVILMIEAKGCEEPSKLTNCWKVIQRIRHSAMLVKCRNKYQYYKEEACLLPIEPVSTNLSHERYKEFQLDHIKYELYENAIFKIFHTKTSVSDRLQIIVAGPGSLGPLITATLNAASKCFLENNIAISAVERNPEAVDILRSHKHWPSCVSIIHNDVRVYEPTVKVDLVISEMLGSFSDNELSPECLAPLLRHLKSDGVVVPHRYLNYIQPIMCYNLWRLLQEYCWDKSPPFVTNVFSTLYVTYLKSYYEIAPAKELSEFVHSVSMCNSSMVDGARYHRVSFKVTNNTSTLHGFMGFFRADLFNNEIYISTHPTDGTPGMFSWYPAFLPIQEPILLKPDDTIVLEFWRKVDTKNVWYEWRLLEPVITAIHNSQGKSFVYRKYAD